MDKSIAVIIPSYNELENLQLLIPILLKVFKSQSSKFRIYLADEVIDKYNLKAFNPTLNLANCYHDVGYIPCSERSFAIALHKGLNIARYYDYDYGCDYDYYIQMDADLSHRPEDIPILLDKLNDSFDLVLGIRESKERVFQTRFGKYRSDIANILASLILGINYADMTTGFHGFSRRAVDVLLKQPFLSKGFEVEVEIVYRISKQPFNISCVPITFDKRYSGKSKKRLSEPFRFIYKCLEMRWKI